MHLIIKRETSIERFSTQFTAFPCESYEVFESGSCFSCNAKPSSSAAAAGDVSGPGGGPGGPGGGPGGSGECGQLGYYSDQAPGRGSLYLLTREEEPFCGTICFLSLKVNGDFCRAYFINTAWSKQYYDDLAHVASLLSFLFLARQNGVGKYKVKLRFLFNSSPLYRQPVQDQHNVHQHPRPDPHLREAAAPPRRQGRSERDTPHHKVTISFL